MSLFKLALRNLLRSKRRTALSTAAVVLGVMYLILGQALIGGFEEAIIRGAEDGLNAHVLIRPADYPTQNMLYPVDELVDLPAEARTWLADHGAVTTDRVMFVATALAHGDSLRVRGIGFDPATDARVFPRDLWKVDGELPTTREDGVALTDGVARLLGLKAGDRVVLQTRTHKGAINALDLPVAAVLHTSNSAIDQSSIYVPKAVTDELVRASLPTHVAVRFPDRQEALDLQDELAAVVGDANELYTWHDETVELLRMQGIRRKALNFLVGILLAMSAFAIANTILMAAHERVHEVGTLRAMGMTKSDVLNLFLIEGGLMGTVSGTLGAAIGGAGAWYLNKNPLDLSTLTEKIDYGSIQFSTYIYVDFDPTMLIAPLLIAVVVAVGASIYPARIAAAMAPVDAVRAR